jgi:hypothetical protein
MNDLTDTEIKLLYVIRNLRLFDALEIKYAKRGELMWELTQKDRGTYQIVVDNLND